MYSDFPQYLQFYPTLECNFSCSFCFNRNIKPFREMSVKNLERFLSVISDIGVKEIDMLGGEPTLYSHFHELIELIKEKNLKTTISTNGSAVEILKELSKTCNGNQTRVGVSVNSDVITQELHEYIMDYRPIVKSVCTGKRTMPEAARAYLGLMGIEYYL
ncbi:MAG: radical SAM protein, partial [Nitrospira sp.]|nr:radical SAM protein [Nitrospira sp.]